VPGGIIGPPCHWGTKIQGPGLQGWELGANLAILLCKKKNSVAKSEEVKTRWSNSKEMLQNFLRKAMAKKKAVLPMIIIMKGGNVLRMFNGNYISFLIILVSQQMKR
jgi:hypothetical protein